MNTRTSLRTTRECSNRLKNGDKNSKIRNIEIKNLNFRKNFEQKITKIFIKIEHLSIFFRNFRKENNAKIAVFANLYDFYSN